MYVGGIDARSVECRLAWCWCRYGDYYAGACACPGGFAGVDGGGSCLGGSHDEKFGFDDAATIVV